jgi:hypothetical protein
MRVRASNPLVVTLLWYPIGPQSAVVGEVYGSEGDVETADRSGRRSAWNSQVPDVTGPLDLLPRGREL